MNITVLPPATKMGGSKWLKAKIALGLKLNSCLYVPKTTPPPHTDAGVMSPAKMPKHSSKSSKNVCASMFHVVEPLVFNDDDEVVPTSYSNNTHNDSFSGAIKVELYPEVSAVPKSKALNEFPILIHLKAPIAAKQQNSLNARAPVDLITVLDVSGSMAGTKLALLKRAMGFVIQNLGPSDRLSVIAFSSTARRLFPLSRMTDDGRQKALQAANSLTSNGGTNITEGLRKAAKVLTDCRWRNPFASIILLSDGQDTYTNRIPLGGNSSHQSVNVPIHVFGFGVDHDPVSMHMISEHSGGTFSFIEDESIIQDSFAQCIGGLLSVVVQELKVEIECVDPKVCLALIKSGSYETVMASDKRKASIMVGDLYAEEERDFLVMTNVPIHESSNENETSLIKVRCHYKSNPDSGNEIKIQRLVSTGDLTVSMEVDRERNRLRSAEAMSEARTAAERGDLSFAVSVLEKCRNVLSGTVSAGERLCVALDDELRETGERMASQQVYEMSGRAYLLSGLSSHSWQRATTRGDSDGSRFVQVYQTPSMVDMVNLSQTVALGVPTRLLPR